MESTLALAEKLRDRYWLASAIRGNGKVAQLAGDWQTARELSERGLAVASMDPRILASRATLEYEVGDFTQGEAYLEKCLEVMRESLPSGGPQFVGPAEVIPSIARITGVFDRLQVAQEAARIVNSPHSDDSTGFLPVRVGQAIVSCLRADVTSAKEQYAVLEKAPGLMSEMSMCADRILGLLSQTMGELSQAMAHLEDALAFCRKAGFRPELAWTCCDYADTLLQRNEPGDREQAMSLLDESLAISSELGMRPLMERVLSRREILRA